MCSVSCRKHFAQPWRKERTRARPDHDKIEEKGRERQREEDKGILQQKRRTTERKKTRRRRRRKPNENRRAVSQEKPTNLSTYLPPSTYPSSTCLSIHPHLSMYTYLSIAIYLCNERERDVREGPCCGLRRSLRYPSGSGRKRAKDLEKRKREVLVERRKRKEQKRRERELTNTTADEELLSFSSRIFMMSKISSSS